MNDQATVPPPPPPTGQPIEPIPPAPVNFGEQTPSQGMPTIIKVMIGCGAVVFLGIPAVLILIVITAINPAKRIDQANSRESSSNIRQAAAVIETCITQEGAQEESSNPYTLQTCANPQYLKAKGYTSTDLDPAIIYLVNPTQTKICIYLGSGSNLASYDTSVGTVAQQGSAKTTCI